MSSTIAVEQKSPTTEAPRAVAKKRPLAITVVQILLWQVAAVLFVEATLFCAGLGEEEIFKLDPVLGSAHLTNKRVTWRSEGYSVSWFNNVGMRDSAITIAKPPGTLRVALLGDSLTESLQVPMEKTFGKVMERQLSEELHKPVQVLNFGVSGYSTAQEYILLKSKVLQYKPDIVLVCYNSRDSFENWSAPDQVITNVRPYALHLPGGKLTIDTSPVKNWMRTPRAKFLQQFEWLRQNSRLWGLFAALELDWSMHNETYKYVNLLLTRPGKGIKEISKRLQLEAGKYFPKLAPASTPTEAPGAKLKTDSTASNQGKVPGKGTETPARKKSIAAETSGHKQAGANAPGDNKQGIQGVQEKPHQEGRPVYQQFIMRSLGSLLEEMRKETKLATGGKFAVIAMPVRSSLCPTEGIDTAFNDFTYNDEITMLNEICADKKISLVDLEKPAEQFQFQTRKDMFYAVHLTAPGHIYVGQQLTEFVKSYLAGEQ